MQTNISNIQDKITGCILGTAVGDAMGLPMEGLKRHRQIRLYPSMDGYHFLFNKGMVSDDTEHTCMVAQAIIESCGEPVHFARVLSKMMRLWLAALPAGVGLATAKAIMKLCLGFSPDTSGVFSAGNGPAMRSAIIGVCYGNDMQLMRKLVRISTRITHTDPKAEYGAIAVALAAHQSSRGITSPDDYIESLHELLFNEDGEFIELMESVSLSVKNGESTEEFAGIIGCGQGVSGYIYNTVPVAIHAWLRNPMDYGSALKSVIRCGGDTDTTAAIVGGIVGAAVGKSGIPQQWLQNLIEWPRSINWMEQLSSKLAATVLTGSKQSFKSPPIAAVMLRNAMFLTIVLLHGFRRIFPPY